MRVAPIALILLLGLGARVRAQDDPRLWIMGSNISFGSPATLTLSSDQVGASGLVLVGLQPLPLELPIMTGKGPFYIGLLSLLVPCGNVPASGRIDLPFTLPGHSAVLENLHIAVQGYVGNRLTNPATIPLVDPHLLPQDAVVVLPPVPKQAAMFGDRFAVGDFNGDDVKDLAVGAWFETVAGQLAAGRVYVMWGPTFSSFVILTPPSPAFAKSYGASVLSGDLDLDGIDDLVIGEGPGDSVSTLGHFYVFRGGSPFLGTPTQIISSAGVGADYASFGRQAELGDLNDDGFLDLIANVDHATVNSVELAGRIDVYFGPELVVRHEILNPTPSAGDYFGTELEVADVNGDGVSDLLEGSGRTDVAGQLNIGRCHVFFGPTLTTHLAIECPLPDGSNTRFGDGLSAFDANGDGRSELVTRDDRDNAYIFWAPAFTTLNLVRRPRTLTDPVGPSSQFGYYFAAGDLNLDQIPDLAVSETEYGPATGCGLNVKGGYVYVAYGPHYATFSRLLDIVECGTQFGWCLRYDAGELFGSPVLIAGNRGADTAGVPGSGRVVLRR